MAARKRSGEDNVGNSVEETQGITTGRRAQERRIGAGNSRQGTGKLQAEVDARPTKKTRSTKRATR
jgi:hypothetical protein